VTARGQLAVTLGVIALVVALLFAGKRFLGNEIAPLGVGAEAPNFTAETLDAAPVLRSLQQYRGNVILVNIWATWCLPCRIEMPSIEKLHQALGPAGLKVIAVSVDDPGTETQIRDFVKQYGLTFPILHDPKGQDGDVSRIYETTG
jgi:thiol-disulfide isomerase/thioredoxin